MLFNVALCSSLLLSPVVLAVPSGLGARIARRGEGFQRSSSPVERATGATSNDINWAGASWSYPNATFNSITGTFTAPIPSGAPGSSVAILVAIDGLSCTSALFEVGLYVNVDDLSQPSYNAWYEWYPDTSNLFSQSLNISAGDEIKLSVIIFSLTSGVATVENLTNGQVASRPLNSSTPLCLQDVAWMVEDYTSNGVPVPLTNFSTVTFTNAVATGIQIRYPAGANTSDINQNGQVLTNTTIHGKSLSIQYI